MDHIEAIEQNNSIYLTYLDQNGELQYKTLKDTKPYILYESQGNSEDEHHLTEIVSGKPVIKSVVKDVEGYYDLKDQLLNAGINIYHQNMTPEYQMLYEFNTKTKSRESGTPLFWYIDIETMTIKGKSGVDLALEGDTEVLMIQIANNRDKSIKMLHIYDDWEPLENDPRFEDTEFFSFSSELEMLEFFMELNFKEKPAISTAHFGMAFDFPFLMNRYGVLKGLKNPAKKFSPVNRHMETKRELFGKKTKFNIPVNNIWLDYLDVYQEVTFGSREQWGLDYLVKYELGEESLGKIPYENRGFISIHEFVRGDYDPELDTVIDSDLREAYLEGESGRSKKHLWIDLFMEYGREDVVILRDLDLKINGLMILTQISQIFSCNIPDTFGTVKPWMLLLSNTALHDRNQVLPLDSPYEEYVIAGGHVYAQQGLHEDVLIYDYTSLYPFCIMDLCMSVETFIPYDELPTERLKKLNEFLIKRNEYSQYLHDKKIKPYCERENPNGCPPDLLYELKQHRDACEDIMIKVMGTKEKQELITKDLIEHNICLAPNGAMFRKDPNALFPSKVNEIYQQRKATKGEMFSYNPQLDIVTKLFKGEEVDITVPQEIQNMSIKELQTEIARIKDIQGKLDIKQIVYKVLINAFYGFITSAYSSVANADLGAAITSYGRFNIKIMTEHIVGHVGGGAYKSLQDTDSFHLALKNVPKELTDLKERTKWIYDYASETISPEVSSFSKEISSWFNGRGLLEMDFESIAAHEIVVAKKKYVCNLFYDDKFLLDPKMKIIGIDIKRSSTPDPMKKEMIDSLKLMFKGDSDGFYQQIERLKKESRLLDIMSISIPTSISDLTKYYRDPSPHELNTLPEENILQDGIFILKGATQTAKAVHLHNFLVENIEELNGVERIRSGDKMKLLPLRNPLISGLPITYLAFRDWRVLNILEIRKQRSYDSLEEYESLEGRFQEEIHYELLVEKTFLAPMENIIKAMDWEEDPHKHKIKGFL